MWKYKPTHPASALRLCSLPLRPGWSFQPETAETVTNRQKLTTKKDTHTPKTLLTWGPPGWSSLCRTAGLPSLCWCPPCTRDTAVGLAASPTTDEEEQSKEKDVKMIAIHVTQTDLYLPIQEWNPLHFIKLYLQQEMWSTTCLQWWAVKEVAVRGGIKYISIFKLH